MLYNERRKTLFTIIYYSEGNKSPILDFMLDLQPKARAKVLREIDLLMEFGFKLGMPSIKKIQGTRNLWELRIKLSSNNYRIFYFQPIADTFVLLHAIHKKSRKTPSREIKTAIKRMQLYNERSETTNETQ